MSPRSAVCVCVYQQQPLWADPEPHVGLALCLAADYGHNAGLKMGWYFNGCGCIEKRMPASGWDVVYEGDIRALADMGWDGVKFDGCGRMCNMTMYASLMNNTGKAFAIENCHWGDCSTTDASSCPTRDWCPFNWYRVSGDSNNGLGTWYKNLQGTIKFQDWDEPLSQPGCWACTSSRPRA